MYDSNEVERLADLLESHFFNRFDKISVEAPWDCPCPAVPVDNLLDILWAHIGGPDYGKAEVKLLTKQTEIRFRGPLQVGTFFPRPDGMVKLACIDFDSHDLSGGLLEPDRAAYDTAEAADRRGLNPYLERSGGGSGVHLWIFFDDWLPAHVVREVMLYLIPDNIETFSGRVADPRRNFAVEVFPKSAHVRNGGVGVPVRLPFWHGSDGETHQFFRVIDGGEIEYFVPEGFKKSVICDRLIADAEANFQRREHQVTPAGPRKNEHQQWRLEALTALPLEAVYGDSLTGRETSPGFLECRDPWSPTGDRHPSASVQTGEAGTVRGRFFSFIRQEALSVFDFLMKLEDNGVESFGDALKRVAELSGVPLPDGRS